MIRIAITPGEPAGIGPDIVVKAAQKQLPAQLVVFADKALLQQRAAMLGLPLQCIDYQSSQTMAALSPGQLLVKHVPLAVPCRAGELQQQNANYVLTTLRDATDACVDDSLHALVTGPVHKGIINQAGIPFSGHTDFLANHTATPQVVMMLMTNKLRVALVTTHLPLRQVADQITKKKLHDVLQILTTALQQQFGLAKPKIAVCGLNPHAGEGGYLGDEEIKIINPVLQQLRQQFLDVTDALPADTVFIAKHLDQADVVLAMYHDQGLPALKQQGFGEAINVTLGLPIIRTSVDHGTALDLAATGKAHAGSLIAAINAAAKMAIVYETA